MLEWIPCIATLVLVSGHAPAQEPQQEATTRQEPTDAQLLERVQARIDEFGDAFGRWAMEQRALSRRVLSDEESEAADAARPKASDFAEPLWDIATEYPESAAARRALLWLHSALERERADDRARALKLLIASHHEHVEMDELCIRLSYEDGAEIESALRELMENPRERARGLACYALGRVLARTEDRREEAEALLERARTEFGELEWGIEGIPMASGKFATKVLADLFELRHLQVGMEVPDIEGEDVAGTRFRLSDYAGKVILLDFWGYW